MHTEPVIRVPTNLNIYKLIQPSSARESLRLIGQRFDLNGDVASGPIVESQSSLVHRENQSSLQVFERSGGWKYRRLDLWRQQRSEPWLEIEDDEATGIGESALTQLGLEEPTVQLKAAGLRRLFLGSVNRAGTEREEHVIAFTVVFKRQLNGLECDGPGGTAMLYFNHSRLMSGVNYLCRPIAAIHEPVEHIRPVDEAISWIREYYDPLRGGRVELTELRLGYFEGDFNESQEFLEPTYVFRTRLSSDNGQRHIKNLVIMPAATNSVGAIDTRVPQRSSQAPRERQGHPQQPNEQ
jgi:hypothetical protein